MNPRDKGKFQEALKQYDNKDYRTAKRSCDKILEKQPTNEEAMALKGLTLLALKEKEDGEKLIKAALKINIKSPVVWHFYAIFHKELKNYPQSLRCYLQAYKNDPTNFNVIRDLSYLQLFLRKFSLFAEYSRKAVELKPNMIVNWVTYSFAMFLDGKYEAANRLIDSFEQNVNDNVIQKQQVHEIIIYKAEILLKLKKYEECANLLIDNMSKSKDRIAFYEKIIPSAIECGKYDIAVEYADKALAVNPENVNYYIWFFNGKMKKKVVNTYQDLLILQDNSETIKQLYDILVKDIKPKIKKSKLLVRLELALSTGEEFKTLFNSYFNNNIKINIPSFFTNVKFIYKYQQYKLTTISELLTKHLESIQKDKCLDVSLTNNEKLDLITNIIWVYFYAAQHFDFLGDLEKALKYINCAIDNTPSVVEFYMTKSKILKHGLHYEESSLAMEKAKNLDLGDRYLNAKHAKTYIRIEDIDKSAKIMEEFVRNPLLEENVEYYQCMWYQSECGFAFLKKNQLINAHRLFKGILNNINDMNEDQNDFYNYCLRRYMFRDFYETIEFMERLYKNKYVIYSLHGFDYVREALLANEDKKLNEKLQKEYDEMKEKYSVKKYGFSKVTKEEIIKSIENDVYSFCFKMQKLTKSELAHYLCVKYFLIKNKPILALKSLKYLHSTFPSNFYTIESIKLFKKYNEENGKNLNQSVVEVIKEVFTFENEKEYSEPQELIKVIDILNDNNKFGNEKENSSITNEFIDKVESKILRQIGHEKINYFLVNVSLFTNIEFAKSVKEKLFNKMKIQGASEDDLKGNCDFWQDKKVPAEQFLKHKELI